VERHERQEQAQRHEQERLPESVDGPGSEVEAVTDDAVRAGESRDDAARGFCKWRQTGKLLKVQSAKSNKLVANIVIFGETLRKRTFRYVRKADHEKAR